MIAALALIVAGQQDTLADFLTGKLAVTNSHSALVKALLDAAPVNPYALEEGVFRPTGGKGWVIALANSDSADDGWTAYARPVGKSYRLEPLFPCGWYLAKSGFFSGNDLVVGGIAGWMGNGPSPKAGLLRWDGRRWVQKTWVETPFEAEDCTFKRQGDRWVARIEGRTYPKHLNVSHAMANIGMRQQFTFSRGRLTASAPVRTMNPMAVLDDLVGAAAKDDFAGIRKRCASTTLATQVRRLGKRLAESGWDVPGNMSTTTNRQFIATECGVRLDFGWRSGRWLVTGIVRAPLGRG